MRFLRLGLILLAFYITFIGGGSYYALIFPVRVAHHILITLFAVLWLFGRIRTSKGHPARGLPSTGLNAVLYVSCGVWLISALLGMDVRMSLEHLWFLGLHVLMFFVVADLIQRGYQRLIMEAVFFTAMGILLLSGMELASWYFGLGILPGTKIGWVSMGKLPTVNDVPILSYAMTGVSTLLAGYVAPLVLVLGTWAVTTHEKASRLILFVMMAGMAGVLLFASSRGGALSLMAGIGTLILCRVLQHPRVRAAFSPRLLAGLTLAVIGIAMLGFVIITFPSARGNSNEGRLDLWRSAVQLFQAHPISGVGVGMFGRAFREVRDPAIGQDKLASAHNIYLNTAAETGILGMMAGSFLIVAFLRLAWRNWRSAATTGQKIRIEGALAALVGVAVHSMVDVFSITPMVLLIVALAAYVVIPQPHSRLDPIPKGQRLPAIIALVIVIVYGAFFGVVDQAQSEYMQSFAATTTEAKLARIRAAQTLDPYLRLYPLHEAIILGESGDISAGLAAYAKALELEPTWDVGWINRAALAERTGNLGEALLYLDRARQINDFNQASVHWARIAEMTNAAPDDAIIEAYAHGTTNQIHLVLPLAEFWHETPLRLRGLQLSASRAPLEIQYRIWAVHDPEKAAALVPQAPQTAEEWWIVGEHALTVKNDAPQAVEAFNEAIDLAPRRGDYFIARARAYLFLDRDTARYDLQQGTLYGTLYEFPNTIWAQLANNQQERRDYQLFALPIRSVRQEFAAVLYSRPAVFDVVPTMRYPAYSEAQLQPWFDLAESYRQAGDLERTRLILHLIYEHAPYNAHIQAELRSLGETPP